LPVFPTEEVIEALKGPHDFTEFDTWKTLFDLAEKNLKHLYVKQFHKGCPVGRYEVASVAPTATATDCPVVLFSAGGLFGDEAGNLGGGLILQFFPPIARQIIDRFEFGDPAIR